MKLKFTFLALLLLAYNGLQAQTGFGTTPTNWSLPQGGQISSFASYGYNAIADGSAGSIVGDQSWTTMDMTGDGKPDLVVTAEIKSIPNYNIDPVFGLPNNPYWKVYVNNGNGYNTTPINWTLPQGGEIASYAALGFNAIADVAGSIVGDQGWTTMDMNGDSKPDLVVTAEIVSIPNYNIDPVFGLPSTPYWKVYLNNGSGFNTTPVNWTLPQGGEIASYASLGFNTIADTAGSIVGDQSWTTMDMNGDHKPDLVVTAQIVSIPNYNIDPAFGMPSTPYWKVYINNGSGFNTTPVNWTLPQGGEIASYATLGFNAIADTAGSIVGDQGWTTMDMNGDSKPDLVVTAQIVSIPNYNIDPVFGLPSTPYWKVYINNGSGFNTTPVNWTLPQGGEIASYAALGFNAIADIAGSIVGDQSWTIMDMNGDNRPDLIVTAQIVSIPNYNIDPVFGLSSTPYWKVYLNNGSGFNTTPVNWTLPQGGEIASYAALGFNAIADTAGSIVGDQGWTAMDMNGDSKPDLVVTAQIVSIPNYNVDTVFGLPSSPYWKVYLNNTPLATDTFEGNDKVIVYPNPSKGIVSIATESENVKLFIHDLTGRTIAQQSGKTIDLSGYSKGVYLINIEIEGQAYTKKIILE